MAAQKGHIKVCRKTSSARYQIRMVQYRGNELVRWNSLEDFKSAHVSCVVFPQIAFAIAVLTSSPGVGESGISVFFCGVGVM